MTDNAFGYDMLFGQLVMLLENPYDKAILNYLRDYSLKWLSILEDIGIDAETLTVDDIQRIKQAVAEAQS